MILPESLLHCKAIGPCVARVLGACYDCIQPAHNELPLLCPVLGSGDERQRVDDVLSQPPPQREVPWGLRGVLVALIAALICMIAVFVLAFAALLAVSFTTGIARANLSEMTPLVPWFLSSFTILLETVLFLVAFGVARYHHAGLHALGFRPFRSSSLGVAFGLLVLAYVFQIGYGLLLQQFGLGESNPQRLDLQVGTSVPSLLFAMLGASIAAPIAEETFFRGLILPAFNDRIGPVWAVLATSAIFAAVHIIPQVLPIVFILGVVLAVLRLWSKSIWPGIVLHSLVNTISLVAVYTLGVSAGQ